MHKIPIHDPTLDDGTRLCSAPKEQWHVLATQTPTLDATAAGLSTFCTQASHIAISVSEDFTGTLSSSEFQLFHYLLVTVGMRGLYAKTNTEVSAATVALREHLDTMRAQGFLVATNSNSVYNLTMAYIIKFVYMQTDSVSRVVAWNNLKQLPNQSVKDFAKAVENGMKLLPNTTFPTTELRNASTAEVFLKGLNKEYREAITDITLVQSPHLHQDFAAYLRIAIATETKLRNTATARVNAVMTAAPATQRDPTLQELQKQLAEMRILMQQQSEKAAAAPSRGRSPTTRREIVCTVCNSTLTIGFTHPKSGKTGHLAADCPTLKQKYNCTYCHGDHERSNCPTPRRPRPTANLPTANTPAPPTAQNSPVVGVHNPNPPPANAAAATSTSTLSTTAKDKAASKDE